MRDVLKSNALVTLGRRCPGNRLDPKRRGIGFPANVPSAGIYRLIEPSINLKAGGAVARHGAASVRRDRGECTARQSLSVCLDHDGDQAVVRIWVKGGVERGLRAHLHRSRRQRQGGECHETESSRRAESVCFQFRFSLSSLERLLLVEFNRIAASYCTQSSKGNAVVTLGCAISRQETRRHASNRRTSASSVATALCRRDPARKRLDRARRLQLVRAGAIVTSEKSVSRITNHESRITNLDSRFTIHDSTRHSSGNSIRSSSSRATRLFRAMMRAQVFQRRIASSFPGGRIASALSNQFIASRKRSYA
jgi:hypothetical protein